jgi:ribonuclease VapC
VIAVDSSALIAIIFGEAEAESFALLMQHQDTCIAAPTLLETMHVACRRYPDEGASMVETLVADTHTAVLVFGQAELMHAREGFMRYGKGCGHRANLNFGDCFAYALAKAGNIPLLFKGDDFIHTDVTPALTQAV